MGANSSTTKHAVYYPRDADDVVQVFQILRQRLPSELVIQVLKHTQYWVSSQASREDVIGFTENDCRDRAPYLVSRPIQGDRFPVREIRIDIWSHDQGWSSYSGDQGTLKNSWTWFDLGIQRPPGREEISIDSDVRLATNLHAVRKTQHHQQVFERDCRPWMRQLQDGDQILIIPRATFPGWENFVEKASIEILTDAFL